MRGREKVTGPVGEMTVGSTPPAPPRQAAQEKVRKAAQRAGSSGVYQLLGRTWPSSGVMARNQVGCETEAVTPRTLPSIMLTRQTAAWGLLGRVGSQTA